MPYKDPEQAKLNKQRYYQANKDKWKLPDGTWRKASTRVKRDQLLRRQYGITINEFESILKTQDYRCAICERSDMQLIPDHNHKTGELRALLCSPCNTGLGFFADNPRYLLKAYRYLLRMGDYSKSE